MAKSFSLQNHLNLVKDLKIDSKKDTKDIKALLDKIQKSDVKPQNLTSLKTEDTLTAVENLRTNPLLSKFADKVPLTSDNKQLVVRRETPFSFIGANNTVPTALNFSALSPTIGNAKTLGPFKSNDGRLLWYDFFTYEKLVSVFVTGDTKPILLIPLKLATLSRPVSTYKLSKGTLWIRADLFSPTAGNSKYTGLKIKSGSLKLSVAIGLQADKFTMLPTASFTLDLVFDNSFDNSGTGVIGSDSRLSDVKLPDLLSFQYAAKKITIKSLSRATWNLYKDQRSFTYDNKQAVYLPDLDKIWIKLSTDKDEFIPNEVKSEFFKIEESAKVKEAGWCLSLDTLDVSKPFAVRSNGALGLWAEKGLTCSWQGIDERLPVSLTNPFLLAEPELFLIHEQAADFKTITETYKLWDKDETSGIKTNVLLSFNRKKRFDYTCAQVGAEGIFAMPDAVFSTDKPIKADGEPVAPNTKDSLYAKFITQDLAQMLLIDQDLLLENNSSGVTAGLFSPEKFNELKLNPRSFQFALENAYLLTTPPASLLLAGAFDNENIITKGKLTILYGISELVPMLPHPYTSESLSNRKRIIRTTVEAAAYNQNLTGLLTSICSWETDEHKVAIVEVDFNLQYDKNLVIPPMISAPPQKNETLGPIPDIYTEKNDAKNFQVITKRGSNSDDLRSSHVFSLLDLSTNYDLLGISMSFNRVRVIADAYAKVNQVSEQLVTIENMNLRTPMALLNGFTLPHISWEPMINVTNPDVSADPDKGILGFKDQGPATIFSQLDANKININPHTYIHRFKNNLKAADDLPEPAKNPLDKDSNLKSSVLFGLPNGKISIANLVPFNPQKATMNNRHLDFIMPDFKMSDLKLKGGLQFRVSADKASDPEFPPELNGITAQLKNLTDANGNNVPQSVLGESVHTIFNNVFASSVTSTGVPLTHIDFSGYGASTYSNWLAPLAKFADIAQVRFNVMRGRLAHEVVQAVSMSYPFGICMIRTITFYRRNNAIIYREDSGWVAKSDGVFDFSFIAKGQGNVKINFDNPYSFHPGLVAGLFNVHNIKEVEGDTISIPYTPSNGDYYKNTADDYVHNTGVGNPQVARFMGITFDADADLDVDGKGTIKRFTGKQFKSYLQLLPQGVPIPKSVFQELMTRSQNSIGGNVDCILNLGGSQQTIHVNRVDVAAATQNDNSADVIFVAEAKGSVQLPADGSWSIVEVDKQTGEVLPVANKESVPIIREGLRNPNGINFTLPISSKVSKVTFPDALLNTENTFAKHYGFVQNTGTQKLLLSDPRYDVNKADKLLSEAPLLADSFRLLNSKGPFPNIINSALKIENVAQSVTDVISGGLSKVINNFKVPDNLTFDVIGKEGDAFRMYVKYQSDNKDGKSNSLVNYVTDSLSADKWRSELGNLSVVVDLASFKSLMTISGDFKAKASINANFDSGNAPQLKLAKPLEKIYQILEFLDNLDPTQPVEAVKKGLKIAMSNAADSWDYKFKASKEIPFVKFPFDAINYNSPTTPLKLDANFKIGCYFNQPIKIPKTIDQLMPSAGAFLELGADLRVMCFSLAAATVYATGRAEVGLVADLKSPPTLYFKFGFGIELAVGLPVIGSVAVMYMVGVDMSLNTEVLIVGAFIYFRGRAEIFGGIVTITIQIEAAGKIEKQFGGPTSCIAMCTFALDISIFWVIDINFSETWEETRQIA